MGLCRGIGLISPVSRRIVISLRTLISAHK
jgi:hypothetical protein